MDHIVLFFLLLVKAPARPSVGAFRITQKITFLSRILSAAHTACIVAIMLYNSRYSLLYADWAGWSTWDLEVMGNFS